MFPGYKVTIKGEPYSIPALSLGQIRNGIRDKLKEHDELLQKGETFEVQLLRSEIILAAMQRNYPDFASDALEDFLDMANTNNIWLAVLGASGFTPGEAEAATTTEKTGT